MSLICHERKNITPTKTKTNSMMVQSTASTFGNLSRRLRNCTIGESKMAIRREIKTGVRMLCPQYNIPIMAMRVINVKANLA